MPKVSVVIPAHNVAGFIQECLLSFKEQTFQDFEVIVVDDGSSDNTAEMASRFAKVVKSGQNLGEGAARNLGANEAKGEILVFTDADVVVPSDWLAKIVRNIEVHNVKCAGGGYRGSLGDSFMERFAYLELAYRRRKMPEFVNTLVANNFACSRDVFLEFGGFPEKFKCEDLRLSFQISRKYPIFWDNDNGVYHHFKSTLVSYLKQQYYFGRDTVFSYCQYPQMLGKQTHQGKGIYMETILTFIALLGVCYSPLMTLFLLGLILIINSSFLLFLKKSRLAVIRSSLVILMRDVVCVLSVFSGIVLSLKDFLSCRREKTSFCR